MYARVLRKWSPNTNLMSFLWPAAVALLLLVACAPPTTSTPTPASAPASAPSASAPAPAPPRPATTTSTDSARATAGASATRQAPAPPPATAAAPAPSTRPLPLSGTRWRGLAGAAAAAGPVPGPPASAGGGEESFFIPVAVGVGPAGRAGPGGPSSSRSSSSSSRTRSSSSSRLISSSWRRGPAPADRLAFAYYRAPAEEAADGDDGEEPEAEELGAEEPEQEEEEEEDEESEESEEQVADSPVAAAALSPIRGADNARIIRNDIDNDDDSSNPKPVPNVPNSQILNLHTPVDTTDRQRQQQRRGLGAAAASVRGPKARRHVQESRQESPRAVAAAAASFHSPVRETAAVGAGGNATLAPLRFVIESFEVPATLPLAAFTEQQRRMLLQQQQLRRLRLLQQQAARSRRDSRAFGASGPQLFYGAQQQQQQPYQRLQQPQPHAPTYGSGVQKPHHHHQHQHQHQRSQHQQHQQQHQQRRRRRYCSARDPAQLAFEAPTVFEGKIVSMTPDRRANFSATVEVKEVFKQQIGFRLQKYLRLQFAYRNSSGECDIYREQLRPRGLVRGDELEQGRVYLLFVQQIDLGNFTILGQPIRKTRRVVEAVKNAVSENYAQLASIRSITASNRTVENGKELRIVCKVQGRPPPKVTWFKDHKSINRNRKLYQIVPFKKRSELIIRSFNSSDAGRYECRAKNKVNRNLERRAIVIKAYPVPRYETHLTGGTGHNCPPDAAEFCFNGGTCKLFVEIGSYSCICPEGFIGERCDRKEVNNMPPNPTYKTGYIADDPGAYDPDLDPGPLDREHISQSYTSSEDADDDDADDDDDDSGEEDETKASRVGF